MPNLSSVVLAQTWGIRSGTMRCLAETCYDLRELDLSMCKMKDEALLEVGYITISNHIIYIFIDTELSANHVITNPHRCWPSVARI